MDRVDFDITIRHHGRKLVESKNFSIPLNRMTVLFGESGIGKSLIARAVYGLLDPDDLDVTVNGLSYEDYCRHRDTASFIRSGFFVFQEPSSHLNPLMRLGEQIREGSLASGSDDSSVLHELWGEPPSLAAGGGKPAKSRPSKIDDLLSVYPKPFRPSGGEKQRVLLAMALKKMDIVLTSRAENPNNLFVFDEPTGSLDNHLRNVFLAMLLERFKRYKFTTLLITHDYSMVSELTGVHRHLLGGVEFKEVVRQKGKVVVNDFQPGLYTEWLEGEQSASARPRRSQQSKTLLRIEPEVRVFGKNFSVTRDREAGDPAPLDVGSGSIVYLKAPSGTGKTTLVKMLMGLIRGERFRASIGDFSITEKTPRAFWRSHLWGKELAMTFQHADEALNPRATVAEVFQGLPSSKLETLVSIRATLGLLFEDEVDEEFLQKEVGMLSGGQKQRLNLLRSISLRTGILILDEPLNGLDFERTKKVISLLKEQRDKGKGILLISHNEEIFDALVSAENVRYLHEITAD